MTPPQAEGVLTACPAGCQAEIDVVYKDCDGLNMNGKTWEEAKKTIKTTVALVKCSDASTAAPAALVAASVAVLVAGFQ